MKETMNKVAGLMDLLGLPYQYGEYDQSVEEADVYFVGDAVDDGTGEDGSRAGYFTLSGWSLGEGLEPLVGAREAIRNALRGGLRAATDTGAVVLEYGASQGVPSDAAGVFRLEITLNFIEWSV